MITTEDFTYFEREEHLYRSPSDDLADMQLWTGDAWVPFEGDIARVLHEGTQIDPPSKDDLPGK